MEPSRKNIFVFGSDDFNFSLIRSLDTENRYRLHKLFDYSEIRAGNEFPVKELYEGARQRLSDFQGTVDGIVGYWDFPICTLADCQSLSTGRMGNQDHHKDSADLRRPEFLPGRKTGRLRGQTAGFLPQLEPHHQAQSVVTGPGRQEK